jgi:ferredoxin-NADP reductase
MTTFHSLTVAKVEPETRDAVTITFAVPQALQEAYRFRPGQHLTLKPRCGDELRRCYSICRSTPGEISVAVKAIEGGRFPAMPGMRSNRAWRWRSWFRRGTLAISRRPNVKATIWR